MQREDVDGAVVFVARGVTAEDKQRVLDGLAAARGYLARHFGAQTIAVCVEIRADLARAGAALTIDDRVVVYTQPEGWTRPYPWLLSRATAHEYVHVWSAELAKHFAPSNSIAYGPGWLVEGAAEFLSMRMVLDARIAPADEAETRTNSLLRLSDATLDELEPLPLPNAEDYATAELAVALLMRDATPDALVRYYILLGDRVSWPAAFAQAFDISPSQFYREFAATPSP
jgi:hypothetical protein